MKVRNYEGRKTQQDIYVVRRDDGMFYAEDYYTKDINDAVLMCESHAIHHCNKVENTNYFFVEDLPGFCLPNLMKYQAKSRREAVAVMNLLCDLNVTFSNTKHDIYYRSK